MSQTQRISRNNTAVVKEGGHIVAVILHSTEIVRFSENAVLLNNGGWPTHTTRTRMNQVGNETGLGFHVTQRKGKWFASDRFGNEVPFGEDGKCVLALGMGGR